MLEPSQPPCEGFAQMADQLPSVKDVVGLWRA
jgi:hypothetical protein